MRQKVELNLAMELFHEAFEHQMRGEYEVAIRLYKRSISAYATAEAHTFLGWTYSFQGKLEDAIAECKQAIDIDPDFGNPYNDIGAYLIEREKLDEAIPWLEKAVGAKRYDARHYPHYNLGRIYLSKDCLNQAREEFQKALAINPDYTLAQESLDVARRRVN